MEVLVTSYYCPLFTVEICRELLCPSIVFTVIDVVPLRQIGRVETSDSQYKGLIRENLT
jgi:hypothetical protein